MQTMIMSVSPAMAREWLANNVVNNRKVNKHIVSSYASDMLAGRWRLTHQGLALSVDGRLIDGQHRLTAILQAGVPIEMMVTYGVPHTAFDRVDLGKSRTTNDVIKINNLTGVKNGIFAMVRLMSFVNQGAKLGDRISPFEMLELVDAHSAPITFLKAHGGFSMKRICVGPILAAFGVAYYAEDNLTKLGSLYSYMIDPTEKPQQQSAVHHFRDVLLGNRAGSKTTQVVELFKRTQRLIYGVMRNEKINRLVTPDATIYPCTKDADFVNVHLAT